MIERVYATEGMQLTFQPLSDVMLMAIGRLVRICSEYEDCINSVLCMMAQIDEARVDILTGQSSVKRKVDIARQLARARPDDAFEVFDKTWTPRVKNLFHDRNVLAHGTYLGVAPDGQYVFFTSGREIDEELGYGTMAQSYAPENVLEETNWAQDYLGVVERNLKIGSLRAKRTAPYLHPSNKAGTRGPSRKKPNK